MEYEYKVVRNKEIDFLKGLAIFLMVAGHGMNKIESLEIPFNIIYSFHMPLLIFLSGYLVQMRRNCYEQKGKLEFIKKKGIGLLLPYISWTILIPWILSGFSGDIFWSRWKLLIGIEGGGIWFLPVLFGLNLMYVLVWILEEKVAKWYKRNELATDILFICLAEGIVFVATLFTDNTYVSNMVSFALPFFFGVVLQKSDFMKRVIDNKWITTLCIIMYFMGIQYFNYNNTDSITQLERIGLSLLAITLLLKLVKTCNYQMKIVGFATLLGKYSMVIYLTHNYFMDWKVLPYHETPSSIFALAVVILGSVITCMISVGIGKIMDISPVLNKILFGRKRTNAEE